MSPVKVMDSFLAYHFLAKSFVHTLLLTTVWQSLRGSYQQGLHVNGKLRTSWKPFPWYSASWISCRVSGARTVEKKIHRILMYMYMCIYTDVYLHTYRCLGWATSLVFQRSCGDIFCLCNLIPGGAHTCFRDTRQEWRNLPLSWLVCCWK